MVKRLSGLPEYGVTLSGSPENPVIENRSGRTVIAYMLQTADQNGCGPVHQILLATSVQPAGIPDGGSIYVHGNVPVNLAGQMPSPFHSTSLAVPTRGIGRGPIVRAALLSVIFGDGQFVGMVDEERAFGEFQFMGRIDAQKALASFGKRIKVITEVGFLGKTGAWDQAEFLAKTVTQLSQRPPAGEDSTSYFERRVGAALLVQERKQKGDAAAIRLAEIYSSLPAPWRN